jgi:hypothetical protein
MEKLIFLQLYDIRIVDRLIFPYGLKYTSSDKKINNID